MPGQICGGIVGLHDSLLMEERAVDVAQARRGSLALLRQRIRRKAAVDFNLGEIDMRSKPIASRRKSPDIHERPNIGQIDLTTSMRSAKQVDAQSPNDRHERPTWRGPSWCALGNGAIAKGELVGAGPRHRRCRFVYTNGQSHKTPPSPA